MKVLLLEDDVRLASEIADGLRRHAVAVDLARTLADVDLHLATGAYDCLVLDRMVPDGDALDLVVRLRADDVRTPVLLLTARSDVADRVDGFEHGADDYVVKPFALAELLARVRALSRRQQDRQPDVLRARELLLDVRRHRVTDGGVLLTLTAKEFAVLEVLLGSAGDVVSRTELIDRCWDEANDPMSNVVDVVVAQLRRKLSDPDLIETVRGVGYRLRAGDDRAVPTPAATERDR